ncbi:GNAT family N-acetyltransferase [Arundinibacter roseus]|uniref:GNAT family N-acetyltransferase n=1 Tax=Arundinibacter roseus TaxID=2070510 RepID=A0A4R4K4F4_9BACT|nr:GNAT family N-acetyltransferase [Arundinibacter roseus]TDB61371.1 GNAT family N-acetyltransferase [Arundinibacter roseus]
MHELELTQEKSYRIGRHGSDEVWIHRQEVVQSAVSFPVFLYNSCNHLVTQKSISPVTFCLQERHSGQILALLRMDVEQDSLWSLPSAPFGGIEFDENISEESLLVMLTCVREWCKEQSFRFCAVKAPPTAYNSSRDLFLEKIYLTAGFKDYQSLTNHHIDVTAASFETILSNSERKRLKKCLLAGFTTAKLTNPESDFVYDFLAENREKQGYTLPIQKQQVQDLLQQLPEQISVFVVKDEQQIIALTLVVRVSQDILYNFCPADDLRYRAYSPTVLLNAALYEYAQQQRIRLIDLGVSLDHLGEEKPSLQRFKENIGGKLSCKKTYRADL